MQGFRFNGWLQAKALIELRSILSPPAGKHSHAGEGSIVKDALGRDWKGKLSPVLYIVAVIATLRSSWIARAVLVIAAIIWLIPDRRIEKRLASSGG
jgi:hypothetical protein